MVKAVRIFIVLALLSTPAAAQSWPSRPLSMVVPFAAGAASDTVGRILAVRLSEVLGQQVVVENVAGAGGMTGTARVAKADPDGYTFSIGSVDTLAINQTLYKKPLYNAATDFEPAILMVEQNALEALTVSARAYVLVQGKSERDGRAADLADDPTVRDLFLGGKVRPMLGSTIGGQT